MVRGSFSFRAQSIPDWALRRSRGGTREYSCHLRSLETRPTARPATPAVRLPAGRPGRLPAGPWTWSWAAPRGAWTLLRRSTAGWLSRILPTSAVVALRRLLAPMAWLRSATAVVGLLPLLGVALTTPPVQGVVSRALGVVGRLSVKAGGALWRAADAGLRFFGTGGSRLADRLAAAGRRFAGRAATLAADPRARLLLDACRSSLADGRAAQPRRARPPTARPPGRRLAGCAPSSSWPWCRSCSTGASRGPSGPGSRRHSDASLETASQSLWRSSPGSVTTGASPARCSRQRLHRPASPPPNRCRWWNTSPRPPTTGPAAAPHSVRRPRRRRHVLRTDPRNHPSSPALV